MNQPLNSIKAKEENKLIINFLFQGGITENKLWKALKNKLLTNHVINHVSLTIKGNEMLTNILRKLESDTKWNRQLTGFDKIFDNGDMMMYNHDTNNYLKEGWRDMLDLASKDTLGKIFNGDDAELSI